MLPPVEAGAEEIGVYDVRQITVPLHDFFRVEASKRSVVLMDTLNGDTIGRCAGRVGGLRHIPDQGHRPAGAAPDRRGDGAPTHQPPVERRHHPDVDEALERDGFAIVPSQTLRLAARGSLKPPLERLALKAADARALERILGFKRRRTARLRRWLIPAGLVSAMNGRGQREITVPGRAE